MVGKSRNASERDAVVIAKALSVRALMYPTDATVESEEHLHLPGEQVGERGSSTTIRHVHQVDAGHHVE